MTAALRTLMAGLVDYAGLFPPASRSMSDAVREYAAHRAGAQAWMLGRFVVPAARLDAFAGEAAACLPGAGEPWRLSVLAGDDAGRDVATVAALNAAHRGVVCDVLEARADDAAGVAQVARAAVGAPPGAPLAVYVEIPVAADPAPAIHAIAAHGLRAKIRTGGVTADAVPPPDAVVRFLVACIRARVAFKATAGLHHPLRGEYALTYAPDAPRGTLYGFLNVFLAAALLRDGGSADDARALLVEGDPGAFTFADEGVRWRGRLIVTARLSRLREASAIAFGSCSFAEPVDELTALQLL